MAQRLQVRFIVGTTFFSWDDMVNIRGQDLAGAMHLVRISAVFVLLDEFIPDLFPCRTVAAL
jgi:hypothetical protein